MMNGLCMTQHYAIYVPNTEGDSFKKNEVKTGAM